MSQLSRKFQQLIQSYHTPTLLKRSAWQSMFFTINMFALFLYHLETLGQKVKLFVKDTNHTLKKLKKLEILPHHHILCTIDVVNLLPHEKDLGRCVYVNIHILYTNHSNYNFMICQHGEKSLRILINAI